MPLALPFGGCVSENIIPDVACFTAATDMGRWISLALGSAAVVAIGWVTLAGCAPPLVR